MVELGQKAPDFAAPAVVDGEGQFFELFPVVDAHDAVVVLFFPADFVATCTAELRALEDAGWTATDDLALVGVSGDSLFSHAAYADQNALSIPLVSDFHGGIAESYGLLVEQWEGHSAIPARATVVVGGDWEVRALERAADALDYERPAPVERAHGALSDLGVSVEKPTVTYE